VLVLALVLAAGCGYGGDDGDEPESRPPAQATPRPPEPKDGTGTLPVDEFNDFLAQARPAFATSAVRTAIEFANAGDGGAATTSVLAFEGPEGNADEASVTVTRDGLADDSVRALRYRIVLERADDRSWRLQSAKRALRCHEGRGYQEFSTKLCR
jgi:CO/xanthine dehydrogenase FAD-binding subunit